MLYFCCVTFDVIAENEIHISDWLQSKWSSGFYEDKDQKTMWEHLLFLKSFLIPV